MPQKTFRVLDLLGEDTKTLDAKTLGELLPTKVGDVSIETVGGIIQYPYNLDENEIPQIEEITSSNKVDYIVVGNNMGFGVFRAYAIDQKMRGKTCIVWHCYKPGAQQVYSIAGFDTFMSRHKLREYMAHCIVRIE